MESGVACLEGDASVIIVLLNKYVAGRTALLEPVLQVGAGSGITS